MKIPTVAAPTYMPITMNLKKVHPLISSSSASLGGFFMISISGGLKPRAVAGGPSVTRFTQSNYTEVKPSGIPSIAVKKILATSPMFEEIRYLMKAFMLL